MYTKINHCSRRCAYQSPAVEMMWIHHGILGEQYQSLDATDETGVEYLARIDKGCIDMANSI